MFEWNLMNHIVLIHGMVVYGGICIGEVTAVAPSEVLQWVMQSYYVLFYPLYVRSEPRSLLFKRFIILIRFSPLFLGQTSHHPHSLVSISHSIQLLVRLSSFALFLRKIAMIQIHESIKDNGPVSCVKLQDMISACRMHNNLIIDDCESIN